MLPGARLINQRPLNIRATVNIGGVLAAIQRLGKTDFSGAFKRLRKPLHKDIRDHRDAQSGPRGPWVSLHPSTKERYAREGKRRNRRILAKLPNARKSIVTSSLLIMRSRVKWSSAHQRGAIVGRGARVPQRQFMWMSKVFLGEAKREFKRVLLARWKGRR